MNLDDQVSSPELSEKLLTLGVKQNSIFYWIKSANPKAKWNLSMEGGFNKKYHTEALSAFTVAELVEILPSEIGNPHLEMGKSRDGRYGIEYLCMDDGYTEDTNFANACAKMLIHLLEKGLITNAAL
jgi:hypothetical protein